MRGTAATADEERDAFLANGHDTISVRGITHGPACEPIVTTLLDHLAAGRSWRGEPSAVPATAYCDPGHAAAEQATLFRTWPQVVALSSDLPAPGCHITRDTLAVPIVVTRDSDGAVHAFANVCVHRGSQVVPDGRSCQRRLSCPYHAWTYDLTGRLVGVPDRDAFPGVEVPGPGLRPLPVVEAHGLIWVTPSLDGESSASVELGSLGDDLDRFDLSGYRHWRSHRFELALNWKLVLDTFLEPYHFASLHRDTVAPLFFHNLCYADRVGPHVRHVIPRRTFTALADEPPERWDLVPHCALAYVLFPNTVFVMLFDHVETWRVAPHPSDPGRSITDLDFYVPADADADGDEHWERNWRLTVDTVIAEDFPAMAGAQRGLASGAIDAIRVGANEPALGFYHAALDEVVAPRR